MQGDPLGASVSGRVRLGEYEILKRLAAGGMAEIFLARIRKMTGFQKMVVIKRILPQLAQNTEFVEMFLDEARIAATLEHPNIVQTYDVGVLDNSFYIAMEYLHGEDVRAIMRAINARSGRMPLDHALHIVISAAAGLHYAHEKVGFDGHPLDIVHRDVSPQNLIVTYEGGVKLLDFGIAKASNRLRETRVGTLKGKVPYMSPEQCRSEPLDRRSDVYSLGILLYELTLSRRLYAGTSDFEVLKEIVEGRVTPPREIDPDYPEALQRIVMRALEKQKEDRWPSAREMQAELERFGRAQHLHATPISVQQFMEDLFGHKIEAWREAQAQGKTLDEHLLTLTPEPESDTDGDLLQSSSQAERIRSEREAFLQQLRENAQVSTPSAPMPPMQASSSVSVRTPAPDLAAHPTPHLQPADFQSAPSGGSKTAGRLAVVFTVVAAAIGAYLWVPGVRQLFVSAPPAPVTVGGEASGASATPGGAATAGARTGTAATGTAATGTTAPGTTPAGTTAAGSTAAGTTAPAGAAPSGGATATGGGAAAGTAPTELPHPANVEPPAVTVHEEAAQPAGTELPAAELTDERPAAHATHRPTHKSSAPSRGVASKPPRALPLQPPPATGTHSVGTNAPVVAQPSPPPVLTPPPTGAPAAPTKLEGEGTLLVASSPWCRVIIDGTDRGTTPLKVKLPAGPHTLLLVNPEFHINRSYSVTIQPNETLRKRLDFAD
jgi:serine/threonine protein kinase